MNPFKQTLLQLTVTALLFPSASLMAAPDAGSLVPVEASTKVDATLPEVQVSGTRDDESAILKTPTKTTTVVNSPITKIRKSDLDKTNAVTTSDLLRYDSGLFTRQRYVGDPNAPVASRGSNPYQSGREMVFVDGMPIWNPLQSSYSGSPRFNLVSPGEVKSIDIISGPFNAEYSGNAMGSVINYNTQAPTKREIYTEATYMLQPSNSSGINTNLQGFKTFGSYADKFDKFTTYFSYNHLENEGQPMTPTEIQSSAATGQLPTASAAQLLNPTTGGLLGPNPKSITGSGALTGITVQPNGTPMLQIGSDGIYHSNDDLYKWKGGYDLTSDLKTNLVLAYENLTIDHTGQSLIKDANGNTVWGSQLSRYSANGAALANSTALGVSNELRETFTVGWGLDGRIYKNWYNKTNFTYFDILGDTTLASTYNPLDPIYKTAAGQGGTRTSQAGTGWYTVATKFNNDEFWGRKDLSMVGGYDFQHSHLLQTVNTLTSFAGNTVSTTAPISSLSGGSTNLSGLFSQASWRFAKDWDATPGVRLEHWTANDGIYQTSTNMSGSLSPQDRAINNWAPKFSLGYQPGNLKFRYSVAKAYRYPVADELYGNSVSVNGSQTIANATLKPEDGTHHNLLAEADFMSGYVRLNLFHENIANTIYSQYIYIPGQTNLSSLMSSIGETQTNGLDISTNWDRILKSNWDIKANSTMLNSTIVANPMNTAVVGNQMPLMPHYRANFLGTYHYGKDLDLSVGTRYQSSMNSQIDNKDGSAYGYTAFTQSYYVDLKSTYYFNNRKGHISAGVDNVNGFQAYFNHPLPQRSYFMQVGYKF